MLDCMYSWWRASTDLPQRNGRLQTANDEAHPNRVDELINPLNAKLNTICHLLSLVGAHHILHVAVTGDKILSLETRGSQWISVTEDRHLKNPRPRCLVAKTLSRFSGTFLKARCTHTPNWHTHWLWTVLWNTGKADSTSCKSSSSQVAEAPSRPHTSARTVQISPSCITNHTAATWGRQIFIAFPTQGTSRRT